jgi:hypothetical protein
MATDPIFCPSWYVTCQAPGYFWPFMLTEIIYEMHVDSRVVDESHWRQPPPLNVTAYVHHRMRSHLQFPPPPELPPPDTHVPPPPYDE